VIGVEMVVDGFFWFASLCISKLPVDKRSSYFLNS